MKTPFVTKDQLEAIAAQYPTPFHIYDEQGIRENARRLQKRVRLESRLPGVFRREGRSHPCPAEAAARGGLRLRLFLHDGADDLGAVRHHR